MPRFKSVMPEYTGGGVYVFTGQLENGNYFMGDSSFYDVRILNADPNEVVGYIYLGGGDVTLADGTVKHLEASAIEERAFDSVEWQEEHLVEDLEPNEAVKFHKSMLRWIKNHKPSGGYGMLDIDYHLKELETLKGNDWR